MKIKFRHMMLFLVLIVAGCAAYFSVWGLSQLFAGASAAVVIMASGLEAAKVAATTALHRYWKKIAFGLRVYLMIAVTVLMLITSAGIYGFLSNAYQKTANKLEIHEGELKVLTGKKELFEKSIKDNEKIIETKNKRIDLLTGLRNNQESRLDSAKSNRAKDKVRADIALATEEIQKLSTNIDELNSKNSVLSDSVAKYNTKALELSAGSEVAAEVGPLKYVSELTGAPMGKVVNYLILLFIFVFDPLAIALVLMTNRIFEIENVENPLEPKVDNTKKVLEELRDAANDAANDAVSEGVSEGVNEEPSFPDEQYEEIIHDEPIAPVEEIIQKPQAEEDSVPNPPVVEEPKMVDDGKLKLEDIKEIKRGFSVNVPNPKSSNNIQRIGSNKIVKDGENKKIFFKRNKQ